MRFMLHADMGHAGLFIHECALSLVRRRARGPVSLTEGRKGLGEGEREGEGGALYLDVL